MRMPQISFGNGAVDGTVFRPRNGQSFSGAMRQEVAIRRA